MVWALIPVKQFTHAKQRLCSILSDQERELLCQAMLEDVLSVLVMHPEVERVWVVSSDPLVWEMADRYGADYLREQSLGVRGLNATVNASVTHLTEQGARRVLVTHGDLPLINATDISSMIHASRELGAQSVLIATDNDGTGSNCVLVSPPEALSFEYGENSCQKHQKQALSKGLEVKTLHLKKLSCDIDGSGDLRQLLQERAQGLAMHTLSYMQTSGIAARFGEVGASVAEEIHVQ